MENIDICHRVCALYHKMALANVLFLGYFAKEGMGGGPCRKIRNIHILKKKQKMIFAHYILIVLFFVPKTHATENGN